MGKIVFALTVSTLGFAASTAWLAYELHAERTRAAAAPGASSGIPRLGIVRSAATASPAGESESSAPEVERPSPTSTAAAASETSPPTPPVRDSNRDARNAARIAMSRDLLNRLADPQGRAALLAEARLAAQRTHPRLGEWVGLNRAEADALLDLLAQRDVEMRELYARCSVDPACDSRRRLPNPGTDYEEQQRALLGPEKYEQLQLYRDAAQERAHVTSLRTRLTDSTALRDADADRLVRAMAAERQKIEQELEVTGQRLSTFGAGAGVTYYAAGPRGSGRPRFDADSAVEYNRRVRESAAQVLTAEQLRVFSDMQEETLNALRERQRRQELMEEQRRKGK